MGLFLSLTVFALCAFITKIDKKGPPPNVIVIFADDMGYGDLGVFGHPTIQTPNLDRMANEGQKWTSFYVAASVCTPSRAGLLTGRLPIRSGMCSSKRRVLFPDSEGGLPASEITIAEALKKEKYKTACIGKWHLGHLKPYLPTNNGFDYYFGIPYSNDMDRLQVEGMNGRQVNMEPKSEYFNVPLMRNEDIIERPVDQTTITKRYTEETIKFINENKNGPFFIYLAHNLPHIPLFRSPEFEGKSKRGLYGDVIQEIDEGVGKIFEALRENGLEENTLVVFTTDNGPWLVYNEQGGSAGLLRDGKGATFEGGVRVPTIFSWKGKIKPDIISDMGSTLDLFPTISVITGAEFPKDRTMDGYDLSEVLFNGGESPRKAMVYYWGEEVYAYRLGDYKAHFKSRERVYINQKVKEHDTPLLYNLNIDPSEKYDVSEDHPDIIEKIKSEVEKHKTTVVPVENQLIKRKNK